MADPPIVGNATPTTVVGNARNKFWLFNPETGFDLTHPPSPDGPAVIPHLKLLTTSTPVTIAPSKTALVIVDMQNYFLSGATGTWARHDQGHVVEDVLLSTAIPAARRANIQIIHLVWGISDEELPMLPPIIPRLCNFLYEESDEYRPGVVKPGYQKETKLEVDIGDDYGQVKLPNGSTVSAGRKLMRDQWNTALHKRLQKNFDDSQSTALPDVLFYKSRLSGFPSSSIPIVEFLKERNITTLLFGGINTDQCVLASLQDACSMGFDTILLRDGCATSSPEYATKMVEYNCRWAWGFVSTCKAFADGVESMTKQ